MKIVALSNEQLIGNKANFAFVSLGINLVGHSPTKIESYGQLEEVPRIRVQLTGRTMLSELSENAKKKIIAALSVDSPETFKGIPYLELADGQTKSTGQGISLIQSRLFDAVTLGNVPAGSYECLYIVSPKGANQLLFSPEQLESIIQGESVPAQVAQPKASIDF